MAATAKVAPIIPLDEAGALDWLRSQPGGRIEATAAELGRRWGWHRQRVGRRLAVWAKDGLVTWRGNTVTAAPSKPAPPAPPVTPPPPTGRVDVTPALTVAPPLVTPIPTAVTPGVDVLALTAAIALAGVAAVFSIKGMTVLFPGAPTMVVAMAATMETSKLIAVGWLSARWQVCPWVLRFLLMAFVLGIALINGVGVFSQLVSAHVGERGAAQAAVETQDAALAAKLELAAAKVADLDRRLGQIDSAIEEAAKRGKTNTALSAMETQRQSRAGLAGEREKAAGTLAALKAERAGVASHARQAEAEAAPIRYVAELVGVGADSEQAIRWLIALMVLCCDPLAIALTAAASAGRAR